MPIPAEQVHHPAALMAVAVVGQPLLQPMVVLVAEQPVAQVKEPAAQLAPPQQLVQHLGAVVVPRTTVLPFQPQVQQGGS